MRLSEFPPFITSLILLLTVMTTLKSLLSVLALLLHSGICEIQNEVI